MKKKIFMMTLFIFSTFSMKTYAQRKCFNDTNRFLIPTQGLEKFEMTENIRVFQKKTQGNVKKIAFLSPGVSRAELNSALKNLIVKNSERIKVVTSRDDFTSDSFLTDSTVYLGGQFKFSLSVRVAQKISKMCESILLLSGGAGVISFMMEFNQGVGLSIVAVISGSVINFVLSKISQSVSDREFNNFLLRTIQRTFQDNPKLDTFIFVDNHISVEDKFVPFLRKRKWETLTPLRQIPPFFGE